MRYLTIWLSLIALSLVACTPAAAPTTSPTSLPLATEAPPPRVPTQPVLAPTVAATATLAPESPTAMAATAAPTKAPTLAPIPSAIAVPSAILTEAFVNGEVSVAGSYQLDVANHTLTLSDDFRVDAGPDLFVILSGVGDVTLPFATFSQQALNAPLLRLGPLTSFTGAQTYRIPDGTGLEVYQSVVIWCDTYSIEFAAAPLRP